MKTLDVDAGGTVATLVGPLVRLAHDDHVLERATGVRSQLLAQAVGAALRLRRITSDDQQAHVATIKKGHHQIG